MTNSSTLSGTPPPAPLLLHEQPARARAAAAEPADGEARLLVCLDDGDASAMILEHGLAVARGLDLSVTAARVLETPHHLPAPADPLEWQLRRRMGLDRLEHLLAARRSRLADVNRVLLAGPAADEIVGWTNDNHATLVALGTHSRRTGETGLGSTAQKVLERSSVSLLLVPAISHAQLPYRRVMVPLDGSCRAESVLPIATRIAREHGAEVILVNVVPSLEVVGGEAGDVDTAELCRRLSARSEEGARDYLDRLEVQLWKERLAVRAIVSTHGDPRSELRRLAVDQKVDLIVMSSHGHSGIGDMPCGSVTAYVAVHAPAPVLIVRPNFAHVFAASSTEQAKEIRSATFELG